MQICHLFILIVALPLKNDFHSIEKEGVDTNKVYYEIPHWSNLSFLAYDSEHGDEEVVENITSFDMEMRQIQIGPNGFLIPKAAKLKNETAPPASPAKTFCIIGNNKANPPPTAASQRQQRQLISGRDFKDILEACRPKNSTYSLPSPLLNLLKMSHNERQTGKKTEQEDEKEYSEPTRLTEWGTVDFQEISQIAPFILTQRRSRMSSGGGSSSLAGVDHADNRSDSSNNSTSSSFASQLTNFLGRSLDRSSIMGAGAMPMAMISNAKTGAYQIQRPPSLDLESDPCTNEQTVSPPKRGQSSESLSSIVLTEMVTERGDDGLEFNEENLRCLMNKHDRYYSKPTQLAAARQTADRSSPLVASDNQGKESPNAFDFAKQGESVNSMSGGLGAALLQYNVSSEKTPLHLGPSAAKRIFSSGKLSTLGTTPSAVFDGRPMSPYMSMVGLSIASDPPDMIKLPQPFLHHSTTLDPGILERPKMPVKSKLVMNRSSSSGLVDKPVEKKQQQILLYNSKSSLPIIKRQAPDSPSSLAKSPPRVATALTSQKVANQMKAKQQQPPPQRIRQKSSRKSSRRKGACNPFRQQDEDEELKRKSHNSRRWSHVFPLGEVEFKRRAGPNWKSLCQPAILPLTIDYFPSPQELEDKDEFQFQPYTLTLNGLESAYDSHKELLEEMVRQRVTQDYQVVPLQVLKESSLRGELAESTRGKILNLEISCQLILTDAAKDQGETCAWGFWTSESSIWLKQSMRVKMRKSFNSPCRWGIEFMC